MFIPFKLRSTKNISQINHPSADPIMPSHLSSPTAVPRRSGFLAHLARVRKTEPRRTASCERLRCPCI
ncbi:hypothetical protein NDU88_004839 [Pleurodeles waltl]|uniref:Uncharacterized protein n=1 Tax=Pleurodeles waltl TaxID=8319 RepID=A0AAV7NKL4_PLEWA|nr:hypothetical protein NDU88_004839 [Pleurodeles waltl]